MEAFARGCNINEACLYANICVSTYYRFIDRNPEIKDELELLQSRPQLMSKFNVVAEIEKGDINESKWYLEKKQGSGFNKLDNDKSSTVSEGENLDDQTLARIIAICVGRSIAEYESAKQERTGKVS